MTTLAGLRDRALSPALFSDCVPNGVLHDVGLATQEMPATATGGGYMHGCWPSEHAAHDAFLLPPVRSSPLTYTRKDLEDIHQALHVSTHGTLTLADLATVYGVGNSLALQSTVFAPTRPPGDDVVESFYDYRPDIDAIRSQWTGGRRLYVNLGAANNDQFLCGSLRFNARHALQCRATENIGRVVVDAAAFGVGITDYVHSAQVFRADATTGALIRCILDTQDPDVITMLEESIVQVVAEYGTDVVYMLHGEESQSLYFPLPGVDRTRCGSHPLDGQCAQCSPTTHYPALASAGFRVYLQDVLGLDAEQVAARWDADVTDIDEVDPVAASLCGYSAAALEDWFGFQELLTHELRLREFHAAKATSPSARCGVLTFTPSGAERGWLLGDYPCFGDWVGQTTDAYRLAGEYHLEAAGAVARLSGVPPVYAISAPPYVRANPPIGASDVPPILRAERTYDDAALRAFWRDTLTGGAAHIGYLRAPAVSFGADSASVTAVLGGLQEVVDMHADRLALCGAWQRVVIQSDDLAHIDSPAFESAPARVAYHLRLRLRQRGVPVAMFGSTSVLERPLASWWIGHSLTIVTHPIDLESARDAFTPMLPDGAPGAAVLVTEAVPSGELPAWVEPTPLAGIPAGVLYRCQDDGSAPVNVFTLVTRPRQNCAPDDYFATQAAAIETVVVPFVSSFVGELAGQPFVVDPVRVVRTNTLPAPVTVNWVTDGLNFTALVGNKTDDDLEVEVSIAAAVADALDVTYETVTLTIPKYTSEWAHLVATPATEIDVAEALADAADKLDALEVLGAYDVTAGRAALARGVALLADAHESRALAAYLAAVRMVYLLTEWAAGDPGELTVTARRIGVVGEGATSPVEGAAVLLTWPLNGREHGATGTTDASGACVLVPGVPLAQRWDFTAAGLADPPEAAGELVEVLVTAQDTGASARALVSLA